MGGFSKGEEQPDWDGGGQVVILSLSAAHTDWETSEKGAPALPTRGGDGWVPNCGDRFHHPQSVGNYRRRPGSSVGGFLNHSPDLRQELTAFIWKDILL